MTISLTGFWLKSLKSLSLLMSEITVKNRQNYKQKVKAYSLKLGDSGAIKKFKKLEGLRSQSQLPWSLKNDSLTVINYLF
jgi:hypothetical protein